MLSYWLGIACFTIAILALLVTALKHYKTATELGEELSTIEDSYVRIKAELNDIQTTMDIATAELESIKRDAVYNRALLNQIENACKKAK